MVHMGEEIDDIDLYLSLSPMVSTTLHEYWVRRNAGMVPDFELVDDVGESFGIRQTNEEM